MVATLKALKDKLYITLSNLISDKNKLNKVVQALIDRTLYIKFLEDNHIINSHFYDYYFKDSTLNYGKLLKCNDNSIINKLFKEIHKIFNNALFDQPTIENKYLTTDVRSLIAASFNTEGNDQLRLFDFQFNILPVEFISYIYEVFLSEEQKKNGIYYTPKKLAQLIIDDVINEDRIGSIIDPSCGSGMFLIVGFQRLLEIAQKQGLEPINNIEKIEYRIKLLSENIFGVEKELAAQRFTLFSLSLQIFKNIPAEEIKLFIANELEQNKEIKIFKGNDFYNNIICRNTLDIHNPAFKDKTFDYIVGNPPFVRKEVSDEAKDFTNNYQLEHIGNTHIAKNIIEGYQISQCFLLKIKEWSKPETRFGFVSNSSNFYDESLNRFQNFFYNNYNIDKIYELSRVKKILFENASESVLGLIFNNKINIKNLIEYNPVDNGIFSEKPFELLIIQDEKVIEINQNSLINDIRLRSFLIGSHDDRNLLNKLSYLSQLQNFILKENGNYFIHRGIEIVGKVQIEKEYSVSDLEWKKLAKGKQKDLFLNFKQKYTRCINDDEFNIPYIKPQNLEPFKITSIDCYLSKDLSKFRRFGTSELFEGNKILWNRVGNRLKAYYSTDKLYYEYSLYVIKLLDNYFYFFVTALLNSDLVNYYINQSIRKRVYDSFPRIGINDIKQIPIPKELDPDLVAQISNISKDLTDGKFEYAEKEKELNELIYDLYDLSYIERQRIKDYFLPNAKKPTNSSVIKNYEEALLDTLEFYFSQKITIENINAFTLRVIKICFGTNNNPTAKKVGLFTLEQIFKESGTNSFLLNQEFIFGKDCVYILKKDIVQNWTETKAFEDGQRILKFSPYEQ